MTRTTKIMRIMALDVGDKRVGIAFSDPTGTLATPFGATERGADDIAEILRLAEREGAGEIVVGMPYTLSGERGAQASKTAAFIRELRSMADIPIATVDERLSTAQANRLLRESPPPKRRRNRRADNRARVDASAAAVILQGYLDGRR